MRSCKTRRPYLGAAFWQRHGVTGSKPRGEQWKSSAVYKMTCEGRGKNQGCLVLRKQLRSHNSLQICKRERITGLVLQEGREFLFAKHVNWEVKHRRRPRRGLWNLPQRHFLRINCKSWGVDPFAGWGWTRWPLKTSTQPQAQDNSSLKISFRWQLVQQQLAKRKTFTLLGLHEMFG